MSDPKHVLVAGDWHGNLPWAASVVAMLPDLLPDESPRRIVHVGDFGVWPGPAGERYLDSLDEALAAVDGDVLFVDGNHEDFSVLNTWRDHPNLASQRPIGLSPYIAWAPRGHRWTWHGRTWVAAGGGVSVDRAFRREGLDWWPEEVISEADHERIVAPGRADVMVCHDAPTSVPMSFGQWPSGWDIADRARADAHRDRLQAIVDEVQPGWLFHGHYHRYHDQLVAMTNHVARVVGLDRDEALSGNYRVVDVEAMSFAPPALLDEAVTS